VPTTDCPRITTVRASPSGTTPAASSTAASTGASRAAARGGSGDGASAGVTDRVKQRIDRETSTGGIVSYFRGNATYALLAAMWITFLAQWAVTLLFGEAAHSQIFVLRSDAIGNVWTWVTSVLSHSRFGLFHIIGNSIVILFFGPLVERAVGSRRFVGFFFASGILAGLGHVLFAIATGAPTTGVLGASGAGFAILGVLTVWRPNMQVLLFFVIPMKIKYLTWGSRSSRRCSSSKAARAASAASRTSPT